MCYKNDLHKVLWKESSFLLEEKEGFKGAGALKLVFKSGKDVSRTRWPEGRPGTGVMRCRLAPMAHAQGYGSVVNISSRMPFTVRGDEWINGGENVRKGCTGPSQAGFWIPCSGV